MFNLLVSVL
jgi:hypothetical protein